MTAMVTAATRSFIQGNSYSAISMSVGVVVILLLLICLIEKELMRAMAGARARAGMEAVNIVVVPLLIAFTVIILLRFLDIISVGRVR